VVDHDGNIYVVEATSARVQIFDAAGAFLMAWGVFGTSDGQFVSPRGIALDDDGSIYVTDDTGRIQKFLPMPLPEHAGTPAAGET
jgi:DNA-binding beta-propeller fold protein YncE